MEPVIVVEVLDKAGRVRERVHAGASPVTLGRAYGNDIILDDEFVSPNHARVETDESGKPWLVDLGSDNGTYLLPKREKIERTPLGDDSLIQLGHTLIRLRTGDYQVPPTRRDTLATSRLSRWLGSSATLAAVFACLAGLLLLEVYQGSMQQTKPERLMLEVLPLLFSIPVWAGLWALASRGLAHHASYIPHCSIATIGIIGFFLLDTASEYIAFSTTVPADLAIYLAAGLVLAFMMYGHLRYATLLSPRIVAASATMVATGVVGIIMFIGHVQTLEFNDDLAYPGELKPPMFKLAKNKTPAQFAEESKSAIDALESGALD